MPSIHRLIPASCLFGFFLLNGCASKSAALRAGNIESEESYAASEAYGGYGADASGMNFDEAPRPTAAPMAMSKSSARAEARMLANTARKPAARRSKAEYAPPPSAPPQVAGPRMVSHEGSVTLRSPEPERVLDSALAGIKAAGGYLESRRQGWAVLKVPSARFDSVFQILLGLADVIAYSQSAEDITAEFRDTELRQKVVTATIARLETLIERARNDLQKMRLLGELKRYREEWEIIEARKRSLRKRAEYASITLSVQGHAPSIASGAEADFPEFGWIRRLDPFRTDTALGHRLGFSTPAGLVATSGKRIWRATAAEGSEMWARTLKSKLRGDSRFWREAVLNRLKDQFKRTDTAEAGGFLFCSFTAHGPRAYAYWVGVHSDGKGPVRVVELYFPDDAQRQRYSEAMLAAVKQGPK